jgi:hypothetical protein
MDIAHAFEEKKASARKAHVRAYFGIIPDGDDQYDEESGSYIVCYCGGRLVPLAYDAHGDIMAAAVWHNLIILPRDGDE